MVIGRARDVMRLKPQVPFFCFFFMFLFSQHVLQALPWSRNEKVPKRWYKPSFGLFVSLIYIHSFMFDFTNYILYIFEDYFHQQSPPFTCKCGVGFFFFFPLVQPPAAHCDSTAPPVHIQRHPRLECAQTGFIIIIIFVKIINIFNTYLYSF